MEEKIKNVSLSFCCKKEWNALVTVDERTRFCGSCKHKVIDFTKSSQKELDEAMKESSRVCGRFTRSQMSETFIKYAAASVVLVSSAMVSCETEAVEVKPAEVIEFPAADEEMEILMGDVMILYDTIILSPDSLTNQS
jgi:hypothetical protein